MTPTLRQLEYAVSIADRGSFHAAAAACGVSQPGLSAQIRELERLLEGAGLQVETLDAVTHEGRMGGHSGAGTHQTAVYAEFVAVRP